MLLDQISASFGKGDEDGMAKAIHGLFERAHGITVEREVGGELVVYSVPPDVLAIKALMEFRFGKPKETVEVQTPDLKPKSVPFLAIPQLSTEAPKK